MTEIAPIVFWNRAQRREETEQVYGDAAVRWLYGTGTGLGMADHLLSRRWFSQIYGAYQSSGMSRRKIDPFIAEFSIPMDEYEAGPFASFNDFFIRRFLPGKREFVADAGAMPAFAEARYFAYDRITPELTFPVKGQHLTAAALMGGADRARLFEGGPLLLARLCPVDYHRYHYPDDGRTQEAYRVPGKLHSVNPLALQKRSEIFCTNERYVSILETPHFGKLAYIEVGAMGVGKIVQSHDEKVPFRRGDEKGYFLFGASTVIVLGEPGAWKPSQDLLEQTARRRETYVRLGDRVAEKS